MLTYYDRAVGIVCLESDVFEHEADLSKLLGLLPASPLIWQWSSTRRYPVHPRYAGLELPAQRDWTRLVQVQDRLVTLLPEAWDEYRERGLALAELGQTERAQADLSLYLQRARDARDRAQVAERLDALPRSRP